MINEILSSDLRNYLLCNVHGNPGILIKTTVIGTPPKNILSRLSECRIYFVNTILWDRGWQEKSAPR
jgi:hypothetical protein